VSLPLRQVWLDGDRLAKVLAKCPTACMLMERVGTQLQVRLWGWLGFRGSVFSMECQPVVREMGREVWSNPRLKSDTYLFRVNVLRCLKLITLLFEKPYHIIRRFWCLTFPIRVGSQLCCVKSDIIPLVNVPWSKPVLLHRKWDGHPPINIAKYPWYVRNPTHDAGMTTTHSCQLNPPLSHVHLHGQVIVYIRLYLDVHPSYQLIGIREHLQEIIILPPFLPWVFPVFRFSREIQWSSWCCWMSGYAT
jgi:hypothetical protein